jgi:hypothetical protein
VIGSHFAVVFETGHVSSDQASQIVQACSVQLLTQAAPMWERGGVPAKLYASRGDVPADGSLIVVADSIDVPEALAYHTEAGDRIVGLVDAALILSSGGDVMASENSISSALSHELLEALIDPYVNASWQDSAGNRYDAEICDGVQDQSYSVQGVAVSDFVLPSWADPQDSVGPFDIMGRLASPFSKTTGGYLMYTDPNGGNHQLGRRPPHRIGTMRAARRSGRRS